MYTALLNTERPMELALYTSGSLLLLLLFSTAIRVGLQYICSSTNCVSIYGMSLLVDLWGYLHMACPCWLTCEVAQQRIPEPG